MVIFSFVLLGAVNSFELFILYTLILPNYYLSFYTCKEFEVWCHIMIEKEFKKGKKEKGNKILLSVNNMQNMFLMKLPFITF